MDDTTVAAVGMTLACGLTFGALAIPIGRWLGGGRIGKLAAFISVMLGAMTASLVLILLKIEVVDSSPSFPYATMAEPQSDSGFLWLGICLGSACLYMLAFRQINRRRLIYQGNPSG